MIIDCCSACGKQRSVESKGDICAFCKLKEAGFKFTSKRKSQEEISKEEKSDFQYTAVSDDLFNQDLL